jgi:hypothetical protein
MVFDLFSYPLSSIVHSVEWDEWSINGQWIGRRRLRPNLRQRNLTARPQRTCYRSKRVPVTFWLWSRNAKGWREAVYSVNLAQYMGQCLSQYSVWLRAGRPGDRGSIPGRGEMIFPLASVSRPALGPTQRPVHWVPGVLSLGLKGGRGVTLTTHPI